MEQLNLYKIDCIKMFKYLEPTIYLALLLSYASTVRWDLEAKKYMIFDQINISLNYITFTF